MKILNLEQGSAEWLKHNPNTRPETAALCKLKP
jgi:hypothetical protein